MSEQQGHKEAATEIEIIHAAQFNVKPSVKTGSEFGLNADRLTQRAVYMC